MKRSRRFIVWLGFLLLVGADLYASPVVITTCMDIHTSGVYQLDRDLTGSVGQACLRIHDAANVELDCRGHRVTTDRGLAAVVIATVKNFTLKACSLPQVEGYSLFVGNSSEGSITKNIIRDMIVYNPGETDMHGLRVVGNQFSEFGGQDLHLRADLIEDMSVIPLNSGFNKIEARAMTVTSSPLSPPAGDNPSAASQATYSPRVYPNPWRADQHQHITFDQLPDEGSLKIFTLSAQWVITLPVQNHMSQWDLRNVDGDAVSSGLYLYLLTTPQGQKSTGQFAVIR